MHNKALSTKILSGEFKGRRLRLPSLQTTRSSKSIVLESFFNTIQFEIIDATFVELFAGSGSIGLEALSRGAKRIYLMEQDRAVLKVLQENIEQTDPRRCEVYRGDTFSNITQVIERLRQVAEPAYFYIDPPFSIREGHETVYEQTLSLIRALPKALVKMIIIEHMTGLSLPDTLGGHRKGKSKKFGKTTLTYYLPSTEDFD